MLTTKQKDFDSSALPSIIIWIYEGGRREQEGEDGVVERKRTFYSSPSSFCFSVECCSVVEMLEGVGGWWMKKRKREEEEEEEEEE